MTLALLCIFACSDSQENYEIKVGGDISDTSSETVSEPTYEEEETGESLYLTYCASCHGQDGSGGADAPGVFNHLSDTDEELMDIIINGFGRMAGIPLTDEEALMIIDYMRANFGD